MKFDKINNYAHDLAVSVYRLSFISAMIFIPFTKAEQCTSTYTLYDTYNTIINVPCTGSFFLFCRRIAILSLRMILPPKLTAKQRVKGQRDKMNSKLKKTD